MRHIDHMNNVIVNIIFKVKNIRKYSSILTDSRKYASSIQYKKDKHAFSDREVAKIETSTLIQTQPEFSETAYYVRTMQPRR